MGLDFTLSDEHKLVQTSVGQMLDKFESRKPEFRQMAKDGKGFPEELWQEYAQAGLTGALIPEEFGGNNMGLLALMLGFETVCTRGFSPGLLLTGDHYTAADALSFGLIGRVVPDGQALATAVEIAERIAANGPLAVRAVKKSVQETEFLPEKEALAIEMQLGTPVFASKDAREGPKAFKEKRTPQFKGR